MDSQQRFGNLDYSSVKRPLNDHDIDNEKS